MEEPTFVAETLNWCNSKRAEKDLKPLDSLPKGIRRNGGSCPCGEATGLWVGKTTYWENDDPVQAGFTHEEFDLPIPVQLFVDTFDSGFLPQYELNTDEGGKL